MLRELCRKYGDDLEAVMAERDALHRRLKELEDHDLLAAELDQRRVDALAALDQVRAEVLAARTAAAPALAQAMESHLPELAMPKAKVGVDVAGDDGGEVVFQLAANPGSPLQPLSKVASGGELARAMLALRSVLSEAPPVLVFDEVDAGIGGKAGFAVGRSLANLGDRHQVLVVTHLPQVAAFADAHLAVEKQQGDDDTVSQIRLLDDEGRLSELARMLSGQPDSDTARQHAQELVDEAVASRPPR
jgi:DNA repair protein RecN (Recombination protein N)